MIDFDTTVWPFTTGDVVAKVRELAAENPHRTINGGCTNITIGACPACIVGQAFGDLGVPRQWFVDNNFQGVNSYTVLKALGMHAEGSADELWLGFVQAHQDSSIPWSIAVARADADLGRWRNTQTAKGEG